MSGPMRRGAATLADLLGEVVRAEPFEAMALKVGVLFGDEEDE